MNLFEILILELFKKKKKKRFDFIYAIRNRPEMEKLSRVAIHEDERRPR